MIHQLLMVYIHAWQHSRIKLKHMQQLQSLPSQVGADPLHFPPLTQILVVVPPLRVKPGLQDCVAPELIGLLLSVDPAL